MHHILSPDTSDPAIEREIVAKGKTAPRVTPADIEAEIASEHCFTAAHGRQGALNVGEYCGREKPEADDHDAQNTPGARVPWLASQTDILAEDWHQVA